MVVITERPSVLTESQCAFVIDRYRGELRPSTVASGRGRVSSLSRRSSSCKLSGLRSDIEQALSLALVEVTGVPSDRAERWELVRYLAGDYFREHVDWFNSPNHPAYAHGGQRTHSVIVYLSPVGGGGETLFPKLGRTITPQTGLLVAWNNLRDGKPCHEASHEARPVVVGEKWVLVTWVREQVCKRWDLEG